LVFNASLSVTALPSIVTENDIPAVIIAADTTAFFSFAIDFDAPNPVRDVYVTSHRGIDTLDSEDGINVSNTPERDLAANLTITLRNELVVVWQATHNAGDAICFSKSQLYGYDKTWSEPICVSDDSASAYNPQVVAISPDTLVFVWVQGKLAPFEIVARRFPPLTTKVNTKDEIVSASTLPINANIYPNPFRIGTNFEINVRQPGLLSVKIYNIQGQLVRSIAEQTARIGKLLYSWDALDVRVYLLQMAFI
jgi:hypothetical protein